MPGEPLRLGPFVGGLNTSSDVSSIGDAELVECDNFDADEDYSLISRPPIVGLNGSGAWSERIVMLGVGVFTTGNYLIGSNANGTYYFFGGVWTLIKANLVSTSMVQYKDKVWIIATPGSAENGGTWDPSGGFTTVAAIPRGSACVTHKERLWIFPGNTATTDSSRLKFSDPAAFDTFPAINNIDINPGDGQKLVDGIVYNDNLMLFKNDSTHVLSYDTKPSDAVRREISSTIGVTEKHCVVQFENSIFIYHEGSVYEIVNYDFTRINIKVDFTLDLNAPSTRVDPVSLSIFAEKLVVRYFNKIYVYGLHTKTWSTWSSINSQLHNIGRLIAMPSNVVQAVNVQYYAGSSVTADTGFYKIEAGYSSTVTESMNGVEYDIECTVLTKNFDLAISHSFKRLFWWGADVLTNRDIVGIATPIVFGNTVLWKDIDGMKTWAELGTWGNPLGASPYVETSIENQVGISRRHVKFKRSLRFRQINFRVTLLTDGSTTQGPCKVFTMTIHVLSKATVTKAIS